MTPPSADRVVFPPEAGTPSADLPKSPRYWGQTAQSLTISGWHPQAAALYREIAAHVDEVGDPAIRSDYFLEGAARQFMAGGLENEATPFTDRLVAMQQKYWEAKPDLVTRWNLLAIDRIMGWSDREEAELRFILEYLEKVWKSDTISIMKARVELAEFLRDRGRFAEAQTYAKEPWEFVQTQALMNSEDDRRLNEVYADIQEELKYQIPRQAFAQGDRSHSFSIEMLGSSRCI